MEHEVVLWVDKDASSCRQKGLSEVKEVPEIRNVCNAQIVIAVMEANMADEIIRELESLGIIRDRIVWLKPYAYPDAYVEWRTEEIG